MVQGEFAVIMAYLEAGCQKPMPKATADVYYDLLSDLDAAVLMAAAKQSLLRPLYNAFPSVALLRELAASVLAGKDGALTTGEAWELGIKAVRRYGLNRQEEGLKSLPPIVSEALRCFGWQSLCDCNRSEDSTARAQFRAIYESLAQRDQRTRALPAPLKAAIESIGQEEKAAKALPAPLLNSLAKIGDNARGS